MWILCLNNGWSYYFEPNYLMISLIVSILILYQVLLALLLSLELASAPEAAVSMAMRSVES